MAQFRKIMKNYDIFFKMAAVQLKAAHRYIFNYAKCAIISYFKRIGIQIISKFVNIGFIRTNPTHLTRLLLMMS